MRHLPYINSSIKPPLSKDKRDDVVRAVAIVASRFIEDSEELYVNYFEDDRGKPQFFTLFL